MSASLVQRLSPALVLFASLALVACEGDDDGPTQGAIELDVQEIADAGFENPAAVIVDTVADVYLVSNVNGTVGDRDGNGFISMLSPEGDVLNPRWIDLSGSDRALDSPQGMAIRGDSLFVADMDCIRFFDREQGTDLGFTCLDDVTQITDIDVGAEGSIFIVDSGLELGDDGMPTPTGTDAVYRIVLSGEQRGSTLARDDELGHPEGIAVGTRGIFVTTSGTGEIFRLTPGGDKTSIFPPSDRHLDGLAFLSDGGFAFTSWSEETVFLVTGQGQVVPLMEGVPQAGGLAFDAGRNRLVVPLFGDGRILFLDMPDDPQVPAPESD